MTASPDPTAPPRPPAPRHLAPLERRVTGTLLEKVLSTPQSYPLTIAALTAGCNQKNNRDPEMSLSEADVARVLEQLLEKKLVVMVRAEGSRTDKWRTTARDVFTLGTEKGMALFAELLLRGPQTLSELRRNSSRMRHELTEEEVRQILAEMTGREPPLTANLGRAPGGRAERWTHTLYDEKEMAELMAGATPPAPAGAGYAGPATGAAAGATAGATAGTTAGATAGTTAGTGGGGELAEKLERALSEIESLRARVEALESKVSGVPDPEVG